MANKKLTINDLKNWATKFVSSLSKYGDIDSVNFSVKQNDGAQVGEVKQPKVTSITLQVKFK